MSKLLGFIILLSLVTGYTQASENSFWKKKKKKAKTEQTVGSDSTSKVQSEYEKFMKDAVVKKGMFNVIKKKR